MHTRVLRSVLPVAGMTLACSALLVGPASAEPGGEVLSMNGWSSAEFFPSFDSKTTCDVVADKRTAVGKFWWKGGSKTVRANGGKGDCTTSQTNVPEGVTVHYQACVGSKTSKKIWDCGYSTYAKNKG